MQDAGHEVVLNTYRSEGKKEELEQALRLINQQNYMFVGRDRRDDFELKPIKALSYKKHAPSFNMTEFIERGEIFIDDRSSGTPLKTACMSNGMMVDWNKLDAIFIQNKIY